MAGMTEDEAKARLRLLELEGMQPSATQAQNAPAPVDGASTEQGLDSPLIREASDERVKEMNGLVKGVAEAANPINIPYGLEWLGRKVIPGVSSKPEDFYTRPVPINEMTAHVASAVQAPFSDQTYGELLKKYKGIGEQFDKENINPTAKTVGELGTATYGGLQALKNLGSLLTNYQANANLRRVAALGGGKKAIGQVRTGDQIQEMGQALGDNDTMNGFFGPFVSRTQIEKNIGQAQAKYGKAMGDATGGEAIANAKNVPISDVSNAATEPWAKLAARSATEDEALMLERQLKGFQKNYGKGPVSLSDISAEKQAIGNKIDWSTKSNPTNEANKVWYNILKNQEEAAVAKAEPLSGANLEDFQANKKGFGIMDQARKMVKDRNDREMANNMFSIGDKGAGVAGALTSHEGFLPALGRGIATAVVHKGIRGYGNQMSASGWQALANSLKSRPPSALNYSADINELVNALDRKREK